jgi:U3 small nucleolar RNA-associated protein 3
MESFAEKLGMEIPEGGLTAEMKAELMKTLAKMREEGMGMGEDDEDELDGIEEMEDDDFGDFDESWKGAGLDEDELAGLLADADEDMSDDYEEEEPVPVKAKKVKSKSSKEEKKATKSKATEDGKKKRVRKAKEPNPEPIADFTPLAEPSFYSSKKSKSSRPLSADDDTLGDATSLLDADASDKERRTKSLRFHTSKIASTSNRRAAARAQRLGGDEDVPYRDRQKARDAALRKNSSAAAQEGGEDLDGAEWSESDKKRAREVREEVGDDDAGGDGDDGAGEYYDLVKRRKTEKIEEKEAAHDARQAEKLYVTLSISC